MINRIYRLMDAKRINMVQREVYFGSDLLLAKPRYISVCAADQRYYQGKRKPEVMRQKLPMALIHEATAAVLFDPTGVWQKGASVLPIPLVPNEKALVKPNYDEQSEFCSSGRDGFLKDYIAASPSRFVPLPDGNDSVYVFTEPVSVGINAVETFEQSRVTQEEVFGVWGDGSMGYIICLILRMLYPGAKVYIFGKTIRKLHRFSFADETFLIGDLPAGIRVDHAFECVGGSGSESALRQIIEIIKPQGCINLLGVSEEGISIDTRTVLDKGLKLLGSSRSDAGDFYKAVDLIKENVACRKYLETLISEIIDIRTESDIVKLFEMDILSDFKTVGRWLL